MIRSLAMLLAGAVVLGGTVMARSDPPVSEFERLLAAAKKDPEHADFRKLRLAYTRTPAYRPYDTDGRIDTETLEQELDNGERVAALLALDRLLEGREMDLEAQIYAVHACTRLGETQRAQEHAQFAHGLMEAILQAGDGRSFETAWPVIDIREEYLVVQMLNLGTPREQALVERDGHSYDVLTVPDDLGDEDIKIYFNIDIPRQWLARHLEEGGAKRPGERNP